MARIGTEAPAQTRHTMIYRNAVLDHILPGDEHRKQRVAVECFFRGDWQSPDIDVFPEDCSPEAAADALDKWARGAAWAVYPAEIPTLSSDRWLKMPFHLCR